MYPTFDEVAWRAYEMFVAEGRRTNEIFACWNRAEDELLDRAARRALAAFRVANPFED